MNWIEATQENLISIAVDRYRTETVIVKVGDDFKDKGVGYYDFIEGWRGAFKNPTHFAYINEPE